MTNSEIGKYANLSDEEQEIVKKIRKMFTSDWDINKSPFTFGVIATLGYLKKNPCLLNEIQVQAVIGLLDHLDVDKLYNEAEHHPDESGGRIPSRKFLEDLTSVLKSNFTSANTNCEKVVK